MIIALFLCLLSFPIFYKLTSYLHPIALVVVFLCIFILVFFIILFIRKETIELPYSFFLILYIIYSIFLFVLLFFRPTNQTYESINLIPFLTIRLFLSGKVDWLISFYNLAANIVLFIPYGIFFMTRKFSFVKLLIFPVLCISTIEIAQFITHRGSLDIDDLILNCIGFLLGYFLYPIFDRVIKVSKAK